MSISASLSYYIWIEAILHCVGSSGGGGADTPTRRKSTNDERIYLIATSRLVEDVPKNALLNGFFITISSFSGLRSWTHSENLQADFRRLNKAACGVTCTCTSCRRFRDFHIRLG